MDDNRENHRYPKLSISQKYDFERFINEDLATLSPREREVIKMRLGINVEEPMSPKEIAKEFNVCVNRIYQIEARINRVLKRYSQAKKHPFCDISNSRVILYTTGLEFELNSDEKSYCVVGLSEDFSWDSEKINIPPCYNEKPVTHVKECFIPNMSCFKHLYFPETIVDISEDALSGTTYLETITVAKDNPVYHSINNCLIKTKSKELVFGCRTSIIPTDGSVVHISRNAFVGCENLPKIVIPEGITSIASGAFYDCSSLSRINIPKSMVAIDEYAFAGDSNLTYIDVHEDNVVYQSIDGNLYNKELSSLIRYASGKSEHSFTVPIGILHINAYAFCNSSLYEIKMDNSVEALGVDSFWSCSSLKSIVLSKSIKLINKGTFDYCDKLDTVYYYGTKEEWGKLIIEENNQCLLNAKVYYYSETKPKMRGTNWHFVDNQPTIWDN